MIIFDSVFNNEDEVAYWFNEFKTKETAASAMAAMAAEERAAIEAIDNMNRPDWNEYGGE